MWTAIGVGTGVVFLIWIIKCIWLVGPAEMAVKVILGKGKKFCDSGFRLVAWFFGCFLKKYPKRIYNLDFPAKKVITKAGKFEGKEYGSEEIGVDAVAYVNFPQSKRLITILESQVPTDEQGLLKFVDDSVVAAFRVVGGEMTWRELIQNMKVVKDEANKVFKAADGVLLRAGFEAKNLDLVIKEIKLPGRLAEALLLPDVERLRVDAAESVAKHQAKEAMGQVILQYCEATGLSAKEAQEKIKKSTVLQKEFRERSARLTEIMIAAEKGDYIRFVVDGAEGAEGEEKGIINAIAAAKLLGPLKKEKGEKEEKKEKKEKKVKFPMGHYETTETEIAEDLK